MASEPAQSRRVAVLVGEDGPPGLDAPPGVEFVFADQTGLAEAVSTCEALFLWDFFSAALQDAWRPDTPLRWVHVAAAGVDRLLFAELAESAVVVTNSRGVFDRPIAEYVLGLILRRAKLFGQTQRLQAERRWEHRETLSVAGSAALVVGTGAIGREIARLLTAVGVRVTGGGRNGREGDPDFGRVLPTTHLAAELGCFDWVVLVAPLTEQTRGMFGAAEFAAMAPGSYLINVGRGPLVDHAALLAALSDPTAPLAGAALDVFATEPLPADDPLWDAPGAFVSPHMSGDSVGWRQALIALFADNLDRWLAGQPLLNVVDKYRGYVPGKEPR